MFDTVIFHFLVFLAALATTFYLLVKAAHCTTPFPILCWMVSMMVIWMIVLLPISDTYSNKHILEGCGDEQVRTEIDRHFEIANNVKNSYHDMGQISDLVDEYNVIEERLESCTRAFEYFHESNHYRYSWLDSLADFIKDGITEPIELVQEYRGAIHSIRVYLRDTDG